MNIQDFETFVDEVHTGRSPFPWQRALLARVLEDGWPDVIDVPTGLGKTSILDVAVFAAAMGVPAARRRVYYVVDRRLVVDEAHEHARRLSSALANAASGTVCAEVANRLRLTDGGGDPLAVTRMRGGVTWDRVWIDRPDQFAIVTGTVDQVGSRLLFRGYGVTDRARSIDAAMVGNDSLILIDEAHLAEAFVQTVRAASSMDLQMLAPTPVVVTMSATTGASTGAQVHRITDADIEDPVAGGRLRAEKTLRLVEVVTTKARADQQTADAMADLAGRMTTAGVVGVVVNTVARARAVFDRVRHRYDAVLLTGRSRSVDRDYLLREYYPRLSVDRERSDRQPLILVATQTVEVGANIDCDGLVSDSASVEALVQRLGRLNRVGKARDVPAVAVVVHDSTTDASDPVYGPARLATWQWLSSQTEPVRYRAGVDPYDGKGLDASCLALRRLLDSRMPEQIAEMRGPRPYPPVLHRSTLDAWTRTSPTPVPDPPIEPYLHGIQTSAAPVTVLWRADLSDDPAEAERLLDDVPPSAEEGIELSVSAVRRWLQDGSAEPDTADIDTPIRGLNEAQAGTGSKRVVRYLRRGECELIDAGQIRPGDAIVAPASMGGCDRYGWDPASTEPVTDVADLATRRGRPILRLGTTFRNVIEAWHPDQAGIIEALLEMADTDRERLKREVSSDPYRSLLTSMHTSLAGDATSPLARVVSALTRSKFKTVITDRYSYHALLITQAGRLADDDTATGSSAGSERLGLNDHQRAVAHRVRQFAVNLALPADLTANLVTAARYHDVGKCDPRFQLMLWGGDRAAAETADELLGKSGMDPADQEAFRRARLRAGYPNTMRHEALSAGIVRTYLADRPDLDLDLVVHLVASHHGRARPLLAVADPQPVTVTVDNLGSHNTADLGDWTQPQRFDRLNTQYGRWGLALLEALVRLADIWCSTRNESIRDEPL